MSLVRDDDTPAYVLAMVIAGILAAILFTFVGCFPIPAPKPIPPPPPIPMVGIGVETTPPVQFVHVVAGPVSCDTQQNGIAYCEPVPITVTSLQITVPDGYLAIPDQPIILQAGHNLDVPIMLVPLVPPIPPLPPIPTRDQVLNVNLTFQGLTVTTTQYGTLPWFEAALVSLNPADRQAVYAAKHAAGDTHCILAWQWSYHEPNQPYDRFAGENFDTHPKDFPPLVEEVIRAGFVPVIFMGGDGAQGAPIATAELPVIIKGLQNNTAGDLTPYVSFIPGWDGVFYGWTPNQITEFGQYFRSLLPRGYLGIEMSTGHIPLGNGPADWTLSGSMSTYDLLLTEFGLGTHDDAIWQVAGRTIRPYNRPNDQPMADDPNPPFYLAPGTPRGRQYACGFEDFEYLWVRNLVTVEQVKAFRAYKIAVGYHCVG